MIKSVRAAVTAALAVPLLAVMFAVPVNAAPEDLTFTVDVQGNDVELIVTINSKYDLDCSWEITNDGNSGANPLGTGATFLYLPDIKEHRKAATFDDGTYQMTWTCKGRPSATWPAPYLETWGTPDSVDPAYRTEPITFTVGAVAGEVGTGSLGSLDFGILGGS
ncbi:hypothetical protein [Rhodococcus spongiicola]|uniref:Secreted protein n=1 Tax=Rhodococcus spongiicola TaxID=2487352 RepID=A0A438B5D0_9NOCA|nr:hypothetical protein [Rhodococcus spongiicola]RVW06204.1 hypothetical protein EF834_01745 [Rhodococcus spongiicola]